MTTPTMLSGATKWVEIDGVDIHEYGVCITDINNPSPSVISAAQEVQNRHGDLDVAYRYSPRMITLTGYIYGDTHTQLMQNIDAFKQFVRLKEDSSFFKVILQDQTDRYWSCRFQDIVVTPIGRWTITKSVQLQIQLKCKVPFAEAVTPTIIDTIAGLAQPIGVYNQGNVACPCSVSVLGTSRVNLFEKAHGNPFYNTSWTTNNCSLAYVTGGVYSGHLSVSRTSSGAFYFEKDINAEISASKYYLICILHSNGDAGNVLVKAINDGAGGDRNGLGGPLYSYIKVQPSDLTGKTSFKIRVHCNNSPSTTTFKVYAVMVYEITAAQFADAGTVFLPYCAYYPLYQVDTVLPELIFSDNAFMHEFSDTNWSGIKRVIDPYTPGSKCMYCASSGTSPLFYNVDNSEIYYSFEKLGSGTVTLNVYYEDGVTLAKSVVLDSTLRTSWTRISGTTPTRLPGSWLQLSVSGQASLKNIMFGSDIRIVTGTLNLLQYWKSFRVNTTIANGDVYLADLEKYILQQVSGSTVNNRAGYLIADPVLMIKPGNSFIFYNDRQSSLHDARELTSTGAVPIVLSYRQRYL